MTMRTARSITSGEYRIDFFMAPFSQELEPPENPGRFKVFLDSLEGFVVGGILAGDGVVVIASPAYLFSLASRLTQCGIDVPNAIQREQYLTLDAEETLAKFMINGWPDNVLFNNFVTDILRRAKAGGRRVRAFGEMVAVLWAQGNSGATVRLEHLWQRLCQE